MHQIHALALQGTPITEIAHQLQISRPTVRKYLDGSPPAQTRRRKPSKLDPYATQIRRWVEQDHLYNCVSMLERLRPLGYRGGISQLKAFVHPLRPARAGKRAVLRYETKPGEQLQFDWGEFTYEEDGASHKIFGFLAILSYSRMRYACFTKRTDAPTLIRCLMATCEYFGGAPRAVLTDRMKSVLVRVEDGTPQWHSAFSDFVASLGVSPRVCRPYTPQTTGKVERTVGVLKAGFWPGVRFTDLDDLNTQVLAWCERLNGQPHATTRVAPRVRWAEERLRPLPTDWAWERFAAEERRVSWDGYISYDGVLYGLPAALPGQEPRVGATVQVCERAGQLAIWSGGERILVVAKHTQSRAVVPHPEQFRGVAPAAAASRATIPLGHCIPAPVVALRDLGEYDRLFGAARMEVRQWRCANEPSLARRRQSSSRPPHPQSAGADRVGRDPARGPGAGASATAHL